MRLSLKKLKKFKFKGVVAQVSQTHCFALYWGIRVDIMLEWGSDRSDGVSSLA
ncbi:uncharacterized protein G2W53_022099 [Senna tora]|uniref:Uncharacterized protein n=1 Tax=Senna tora TaxID=362788 RepID=A0A834WHU4_9FABA|nr:uncharacterized protein G2W53_022099 [Senna tora]